MTNVLKLKQYILDLALKGKLVEQRSSEGTAASLLTEITEKKAKLISDGLIKKGKSKETSEDDEPPFDIPKSWKWVKLSDVASVNGGYAFKSEEYEEKGIRIIRISDFNEKGFINNKIVRQKYKEEFKPFLLDEKDILLCMTGGTVGKSYFVTHLDETMVVNQRVATIKIINPCKEYINYVILSSTIQDIIDFTKNSTNDNISIDTINSFPIPLPPLEEQKRIVQKLNEIFKELERIENNQEKLYNIRNNIISKAMELAIKGKLVKQNLEDDSVDILLKDIEKEKLELVRQKVLKNDKPLPKISDEEIPFEIPSNWKWVRLADIGSTNIGLTYHPEDIVENGTLVIRSSNIRNGKMDYNDCVYVNCEIADNEYLKTNDIVICSRNGSKSLVGKNAIYYGESNKVSFGAFMAVFRTRIYDYAHLYFNTDFFKSYFSNDDSKQINQVTQSILKESLIPIPPLEEQKRIVNKFNEILQAVDRII